MAVPDICSVSAAGRAYARKLEQERNVTGDGEMAEPLGDEPRGDIQTLASGLKVDRPIVLVGLMGAGKTTVGRRLATLLKLPFVDADEEIEKIGRAHV